MYITVYGFQETFQINSVADLNISERAKPFLEIVSTRPSRVGGAFIKQNLLAEAEVFVEGCVKTDGWMTDNQKHPSNMFYILPNGMVFGRDLEEYHGTLTEAQMGRVNALLEVNKIKSDMEASDFIKKTLIKPND